MSGTDPLRYDAPVDDYRRQAEALFAALQAGDEAAQWRVKWEHLGFRGNSIADVRAAALALGDAQEVIAREHGFEDWIQLEAFAASVRRDPASARFESAVEAVISGDAGALRAMLLDTPDLARARSARRHHATLLHYLAANGVEGFRQKTPANAVEIARLLLDAGADPDALADMYDEQCTTMSMLVSSSPPDVAGLQTTLAETLVDYGAALEGRGSKWQSPVMTALLFGYLRTAEALAGRGAPADDIAAAAGLGRVEETARLIPRASREKRHVALALAAQHGHAAIVGLLLDAGEDPNRYNPDGCHSHSTPLHQAIAAGHDAVVRLLVARGARLDMRDTIYDGTPLGWARYCGKPAIAEYLRAQGAD